MLEYREFMKLTDDEIKFIINDMFEPDKICSIVRDARFNEILVEMITPEFHEEKKPVKMTLSLGKPNSMTCGITHYQRMVDENKIRFHVSKENELKWSQYLLAKGCDYRLKDNPYLEREEE